MKKIFLTMAVVASVAVGCESTDLGGTGGSGGTGGTGGTGGVVTTWTSSDLTVVGVDECMFFLESEALTFELTIDGTNATLVTQLGDSPESVLTVSTDSYSPSDDEVTLTGSFTNDEFAPCEVSLDDAFRLLLDDQDSSLDQNTTVTVTWDHVEEELSTDECAGVWFNDLPCAGEATLTLTQAP